MTTLTTMSFDALARHSATPCVSIILPIDRRHPDDRRVHLELKSLIASARAQLKAMDTPDIDDLLEPTEMVLQRTVIAEHSGGLAMFFAPGFAAEFAIDAPVQALATTGSRFTIGPLLPASRAARPAMCSPSAPKMLHCSGSTGRGGQCATYPTCQFRWKMRSGTSVSNG